MTGAAAAATSPAPGAAPGRRPNILMMLTDDHAAHAISAYGSVVNRTPRIDEIGAHGARLENRFATNSLCSPSRASILTGTYSHINGVTTLSTPIDASQPTFVSQLRAAGYRTAIVGKWHMGDGDGHDPQNFDYWDVLLDQSEYHDPRFLSGDGLRQVRGYATDIITDLAADWVEGLAGDAPWCVLICHKAPHRPWEPDEKHAGLYGDPIPLPATFHDDYATRTSSARRAAMRIAEHLNEDELNNVYDDPSYREIRADLKRGLRHAQAGVGDVPHPSQPVPEGVAPGVPRPDATGTGHSHVAAD